MLDYFTEELLSLGLRKVTSPTTIDFYLGEKRMFNIQLRPGVVIHPLNSYINQIKDDKMRIALITLWNEISLYEK